MKKETREISEKSITRPRPSSDAALNRMKAAKPRDTAAEKAVRSALHRRGLRFRIDTKPIKELNRRADIIFRPERIAIFIDGCFWHGCPMHGTQAKANAEFWRLKIKRNQERDLDTTKKLEECGWKVIRIWEHEDPEEAAQKIYNLIKDKSNAKEYSSLNMKVT